MPDLKQVMDTEFTIPVKLYGRYDILVTYRPMAHIPIMPDPTSNAEVIQNFITIFVIVVAAWDVEWNGEKVPITVERLSDGFPTEVLQIILSAIDFDKAHRKKEQPMWMSNPEEPIGNPDAG